MQEKKTEVLLKKVPQLVPDTQITVYQEIQYSPPPKKKQLEMMQGIN